jgi:hypothetical protein
MQQKYNCPDAGCRVEGSIPGLKRHLQKSHGMTRFDAHVAADMIRYNTTRRTPAPEFGVVEDDVSIKRKRRSSNAGKKQRRPSPSCLVQSAPTAVVNSVSSRTKSS